MLKRLLQILSISRSGFLLIVVGSISWSLTMVKSGWVYSYGMGFWGPNGHDGVWHIALANSLAKGSWNIPVFAGETIKNYHIGFDLILAILHKLTLIPVQTLYFQLLPPILAILIGILCYKFVYLWKKSSSSAFWATFFVYFGGSWGWLVTGIRNKELGGESVFWSQQAISTLINPPFALSLVFLFAGLCFLVRGLRVKEKKLLVVATFLFGVLVQIKVYGGILVLIALFASGVWRLLKRKGTDLLKVFVGALVISVLVFSPTSLMASQTLIYKPFWFLESMLSTPDRVHWPRFAEALANYRLAGNWAKGFVAYGVAFAIFWFGNLGTRVLKEPLFIRDLKIFKKLSYVEVLIYTLIFVGVLVPTLFVQTGTPWNTIQFFYYSLVFSGILAGTSFDGFIQKSKLNNMIMSDSSRLRIIVVGILILTVPTTVGTLWFHYLPGRPPAKISNEELGALNFLKGQPDGVVLTLFFSKDKANAAIDNPPRPLYLYESTAYVSAFSGKATYLEDEVNLEITGYSWRERKEEIENYLTDKNFDYLVDNNINYLYFVKPLSEQIGYIGGVEEIFSNEEVSIFRVIKEEIVQ